MYRKSAQLLAAVGLLLALSAAAFGQLTGGQITGTVIDATGALVQNATVTVTSRQTGVSYTTQTTGAGSFNFPNVPVGEYTVAVESSGFARVTREAKVALNQTTTVDFNLQTGQLAGETVTVTATTEAIVQADNSQLAKSYEEQLVKNLPIFGNQNTLALLSPNVVSQSAGTAGSGGSVGGTRPRNNIFTVDGVENNDPSVTGPATAVIQDAVQEFTLLANNFNAEFGQGGGGQFVTITKSGTNEFHGNGFVYAQNNRLNAASTLEEANLRASRHDRLPRFRDTRFGFTLGGPIVRNQLFFFGALEQEINDQEGTSTSFLSPTPEGLARLSALPGASPFVINLLRNNLALANTATQNVTVLGQPIPVGEVALAIPNRFDQRLAQMNIDWNRTNDQFRFRFSPTRFRAEQPGSGNVTFNNLLVYDTKLFSATWVRTFSPSVVNDLRLSYRRTINDYPLKDPALENFPNITVNNLGLSLGPNENLPQGGFDNSYQVFNTLNYIRGAHNFKFGAEYRNLIFTSFFLPRGRGDYVYSSFDVLIRDLAPDAVDLRGVGSGGFTGNQQRYYFFGQDDWKVTPNLTLNLGLRYEYVTLPRDARLQALNKISDAPGFVTFDVPKTDKNNFAPRAGFAYTPTGSGGLTRWLFGSNPGDSSIRGNFSMSYSEVFQNLVLLQLPPQFQQELDVRTANTGFGLNLNTRFLEQGGIPPRPVPPTTRAAARLGTSSLIVDQRLGEIYSFALSFQRSLGRNMGLELRYLGTRGRHLPVQIRRNEPIVLDSLLTMPTFFSTPTAAQLAGLQTYGSRTANIFQPGGPAFFPGDAFAEPFGGFITAFEPVGNSNYDSGSISLTRRFSNNFAFTTAYTFSKTMDNSTNELFTSRVNPRRPQYGRDLRNEWGLSVFDIPHRFVFGANWEVPWFKNSGNAFVRGVLGGWEFAPIFQAQSGQPITPLSNVDANFNFDAAGDRTIVNPAGAQGTGSGVRAVALVGGQVTTVPLGDPRAVAYVAINPNARYIQAGPLARANAGRNTLRANGYNRTDLTALKNFRFGEERYNLQFGAEIFNLWNQRIRTIGSESCTALQSCGVGATTVGFPFVSSTLFNDYSIGNFGGRTIQMRAKFIF